MYITHQPQFVHVKFHGNASFFCRSHFQKSMKNGIFTTSCSIKTDLLITQTLEMWYVYDSPTIVCPCKISRQCRTSCRSDVRKSTENGIFKAFCSIKTDLPITQRLEIQYVHRPPTLVCSYEISCQCCSFCRGHMQKCILTAFCSIF